jgi:hypothetical protein
MHAKAITKTLNGRWHRYYGMTPCPCHDDRHSSLTIRDGDHVPLFKCHAGCNLADLAAKRRRMGLYDGSKATSLPVPVATNDNAKWARKIWRETVPVSGTLVETYLRSRAISLSMPPCLRFHPNLRHPVEPTGLQWWLR